MLISLTEHDGYSALIKPINELCEWVQKGKSDFIKEGLLSYNYISTVIENEPSIDQNSELDQNVLTSKEQYHQTHDNIDNSQEENQSNSFNEQSKLPDQLEKEEHQEQEEQQEQEEHQELEEQQEEEEHQEQEEQQEQQEQEEHQEQEEQQEQEEHQEQEEQQEREEPEEPEEPEGLVIPTFKVEDSRILIGKASNSNKEIYWEYGNKGLANRHLLISGKSGQGKTYFMQCLLLEKSKQGIPSIVIDYTEGFLPNQLEQEFVEHLGEKFKQTVVYIEKFPINPFKKNVREISGLILPESETDVAERIKSVFAAVYKSLGIQQLNAIYEATLRGLSKHGDSMDLTKLKEVLEEDGSNYARTALSQIRPLIDRNPFSNDAAINWNEVVDSNGEVYIIQLTGYPRDVQLMITEFILWDLWNYSVRHGNKNKPMPVVMDEAQNLDHTEKSPSARILTEGRKFGWSGWYATQFLKSQLDAGELARLQNASQQIYFAPPEQEISTIASTLAQDASEKKQWEAKLSGLKKGQCIVYGPIVLENGELSKPTALIVDITSLDKRI
ncbi:DUF87 domain-containing protein [Fictibacillus nanhaiensis]|nr:DUF87 domain-containing protein [Fictibacillus nanhaiensis]